MEEMDIRLFFLAQITRANCTGKNTDSEYPPPVARATNHFYRSSCSLLVMINISIPCLYCPQKNGNFGLRYYYLLSALQTIFYQSLRNPLTQSTPPA
jgi:hypothetical protein